MPPRSALDAKVEPLSFDRFDGLTEKKVERPMLGFYGLAI